MEVEVCGLGAELLDAQGMGKKRRAAGVSVQLGAPPDTTRHHPAPHTRGGGGGVVVVVVEVNDLHYLHHNCTNVPFAPDVMS